MWIILANFAVVYIKEMIMNIVVLDGYSVNPGDLSWDKLEKLGSVTVYERTSKDDVVRRAKDADAVLTNKVVISSDILEKLPKLKYVGVLATGYNVVDIAAAKGRGVVVTNIPAYSTDSVVQMTFAHILNITNRVAHYARENREGKWTASPDFCYWDTPLPELSGLTLGIVGLGNIGMKVARVARTFGMEVYAATSKNSASLPEGIQKTTFDGLLGVCDILSLHCPLTASTREMVNSRAIEKMKCGAVVINVGRGALVNESDVAEALSCGRLSAYGADVMCEEPPRADSPLLSAPNAFITPHIAWATLDARRRLMNIAAGNLEAYVNGAPINVVD